MPVIAIIAIVVIVIILNKTGVSDSLAALTLATVAALLTGGGAAGAASVALTPFVGVPVGIFVGILCCICFGASGRMRPYRRWRRPCASVCLWRHCMPPAPSITTIPALPPAAE